MSKKEQGFISIYEDASWNSETFSNPDALWLDAETLALNKEIKSLDNLTRGGRAYLPESQVSGAVKPGGAITYQPRPKDLNKVLYSHFQYGTLYGTETSPGTSKYVPSKFNPTYSDFTWGEGTYGGLPGAVYSVSFIKKYFDTTDNGGTNSTFYKHGVCNTLEFINNVGGDLVVKADYKFRDYESGTAISANPPEASVGTYSEEDPWEWYHGTVLVSGADIGIKSLSVKCSNNLIEKTRVGRQNPEEFTWGDYTVEGNFVLDFPTDGLASVGSMLNLDSFSLSGTYLNGSNFLSIDMPNCKRMPYNVFLSKNVDSNIPFKAFEDDGTAPITVNVRGGIAVTDFIWDALNGARTLGDFAIFDAGNGIRNLSEYTLYDRDA